MDNAGDRPPRYGTVFVSAVAWRGTGPRATVNGRFSSRPNAREGQALALRWKKRSAVTVGRGPVPRHAAHYNAADSYPENLDNRVNPASDLNAREGQALALQRWTVFVSTERSRGTGPRATVNGRFSSRPAIARDRPSRYGERTIFVIARNWRGRQTCSAHDPSPE